MQIPRSMTNTLVFKIGRVWKGCGGGCLTRKKMCRKEGPRKPDGARRASRVPYGTTRVFIPQTELPLDACKLGNHRVHTCNSVLMLEKETLAVNGHPHLNKSHKLMAHCPPKAGPSHALPACNANKLILRNFRPLEKVILMNPSKPESPRAETRWLEEIILRIMTLDFFAHLSVERP